MAKKIINAPGDYVDEMLAGLVAAHSSIELVGDSGRVVRRRGGIRAGKVGIVSGGGSGHLPLFTGYVGHGLLDSCSIGNVFEGPNAASCMEAIRAADGGAGVLLLYGNYGGDRMNFDMASEMLADEGLRCRTVLGTDDVASASLAEASKRRGVAGIVLAYKIAGAAAEAGADLDSVAAVAAKAVAHTRSIGVALSSCHIPGAAGPSFLLGDDEMEMGMGIHGEPGLWRGPVRTADALAEEMADRLLPELSGLGDGRLAVLVNTLGATPLEELYIVYRRLADILAASGHRVVAPLIGAYATSMEMAGLSVSLCALDEELALGLAAPAHCPFWSVSR